MVAPAALIVLVASLRSIRDRRTLDGQRFTPDEAVAGAIGTSPAGTGSAAPHATFDDDPSEKEPR